MKCPRCASLMTDDCRYCPQCGKSTVLAGSDALTIPLDSEMFAAFAASKSVPARSEEAADSRRAAPTHTLLAEANLFRIRRQYTQAIDNCVEALRAQPGDQTAHSLLGDIYRDQGKTDDAIQWYRMALDLGPNASDEAKLKKQEQERARQANASDQRRNNTRSRLAPISASGSLPAGTVYLMGISPRRWLHGITVASLSFLGLLLLALSYTKMTHPRESVSPTVISEAPAVTVNGGGVLPEARPGGGSVASGAAPVASAAVGSGLRPDLVPARGARRPNPPTAHKTTSDSSSGTPSAGTPLAPVLSVKPLPQEAEPDFAGSTSHFGFGNTAERGAPSLNNLNGLVLPGGFRITHVQPEPAADAAAMMLTAPTDAQRDSLLRGLYRAAHAAFDADPTLTRVTVSIMSESNAGLAASSLVTADVDRISALTASPDSDAPEYLESRLLSIHWAALPPPAAPEASSGNSIRILPTTPDSSS